MFPPSGLNPKPVNTFPPQFSFNLPLHLVTVFWVSELFGICYSRVQGFPGGSVVKNPPASAEEPRVQSLGWEDPLEEEMANHSSIIAWKIPWTEEAGRLQSLGSQRVRHD